MSTEPSHLERLVEKHGQEHRSVITAALVWLREEEPSWQLLEPIHVDRYIASILDHVTKLKPLPEDALLRCCVCLKMLPQDAFARNRRCPRRGFRSYQCLACTRVLDRNLWDRLTPEQREARRAYMRKWFASPKGLEALRRNSRIWRARQKAKKEAQRDVPGS